MIDDYVSVVYTQGSLFRLWNIRVSDLFPLACYQMSSSCDSLYNRKLRNVVCDIRAFMLTLCVFLMSSLIIYRVPICIKFEKIIPISQNCNTTLL